jgi:hypothetical protein
MFNECPSSAWMMRHNIKHTSSHSLWYLTLEDLVRENLKLLGQVLSRSILSTTVDGRYVRIVWSDVVRCEGQRMIESRRIMRSKACMTYCSGNAKVQ